MVGESLKAHVRRLRLERAAHRLKGSDQAVTRIAFDAGYETHESFTRAFRAMFGESPSGFRELYRPVPYPGIASGVHYDPDAPPTDFNSVQGDKAMEIRIEDKWGLTVLRFDYDVVLIIHQCP